MSGFFSLDDDDDRMAGPSDQGAQARNGTHAAPLPTSRTEPGSSSTPRGQNTTSASNPIYAMLGAEERGAASNIPNDRNGTRSDAVAEVEGGRHRREPPITQLQRAWVCERAAPEILAWKGNAVDDVCSQIEEQMTIVESLVSDASTAEEEHVRLGLVELDVERARWLLKSYVRCRLDKIEQHAMFLQQDTKSRRKLSDLEKGYCVKFNQIHTQHYQNSVLEFLPANLRSLEDKAESGSNGRGDMVTQPDLNRPVFIRCLEDCGSFTFRGHEDTVSFSKGSIHFVRYDTVRHLIEREQVDVL